MTRRSLWHGVFLIAALSVAQTVNAALDSASAQVLAAAQRNRDGVDDGTR